MTEVHDQRPEPAQEPEQQRAGGGQDRDDGRQRQSGEYQPVQLAGHRGPHPGSRQHPRAGDHEDPGDAQRQVLRQLPDPSGVAVRKRRRVTPAEPVRDAEEDEAGYHPQQQRQDLPPAHGVGEGKREQDRGDHEQRVQPNGRPGPRDQPREEGQPHRPGRSRRTRLKRGAARAKTPPGSRPARSSAATRPSSIPTHTCRTGRCPRRARPGARPAAPSCRSAR